MRGYERVRSRSARDGRPLAVAGLFAGIGGLEKGLSRAGHEARLLCENDPGAAAVLAARFPGVRLASDVRELESLPREVELLTAGFPCQDLSQAGSVRGIRGARSGLVGEVFRLLERRPVPWVLLENVPFMLHLQRGKAMALITRRLGELGYRWAYRVVDAMAFGLPQRRRRVFLLASLAGNPADVLLADEQEPPAERYWRRTGSVGFYWTEGNRGVGWAVDAVPTLKGGSGWGIPSPPAVLLPSGALIRPTIQDAERLQGFAADWTKPAETVGKATKRWKLVGNAVSVKVAEWIGRRLPRPGCFDERRKVGPVEAGGWPGAACDIGDGPTEVQISEWPVSRRLEPIHAFLRYPGVPLSERATAGFLLRARAAQRLGNLRFEDGFLEALAEHVEHMRGGGCDARRSLRKSAASLVAAS